MYNNEEILEDFSNYLDMADTIFTEANNIESEKRTAKMLPKDIQEKYYDITEEDITFSFIMDTFGEFDGQTKINPYDLIIIPKDKYGKPRKKNKNEFTTTIGLWIFNKYFIEKELFDIFGYINTTINKKQFKAINKKLSYAIMEDDITIDVLKRYLMKTQKVMPFVSILAPNYSEKMLTCTREINKYKDKLIAENKEAIEAGDIVIMDKIDKQILDFALKYMGDDPSMDTFISGARSSIPNNFKNIFCTKGITRNPDPNTKVQYNYASSSYLDGIKSNDYALYANTLAGGSYSRSKKTAIGGYWEKLFVSGFQHLHISKDRNYDCGTDRYITVTFNNETDLERYMYSYVIKPNGQLEEITSKNMNKYLGKTVKLRFSSMCNMNKKDEPDCFCAKCAGNFFYRLYGDEINVGLGATQIASKLKLVAMKAFHDSTVNLSEMDPMKAFGLKD